MSYYRTLPAQGNIYPIEVSHNIVGCGEIADGVSVHFGDYGGGCIGFATLSGWYWRAVLYRLVHVFFWVKTLVVGPSWTKRENI